MKHTAIVALTCVLCALMACKSKGSNGEKTAASGEAPTAGEEKAAAVGSFAAAKLSDFETRAKKAGWAVLTTHSDTLTGIEAMDLELESKSHYAYVSVVALTTKEAKPAAHAAKMGSNAGVAIHVEGGGGSKTSAQGILDKLLAKTPVDSLSRDSLKAGMSEQKLTVDSTESVSEDGVTHTSLEASADEVSVSVDLFDFSQAKKDGRVAIDGDRFMNVFVCSDCTKRKEGAFAEAWQSAKARVLLGKLTNP